MRGRIGRTKPRDPVTTRYVAALSEAVGTDTVMTLDVHNLAAFQNAFRCRTASSALEMVNFHRGWRTRGSTRE